MVYVCSALHHLFIKYWCLLHSFFDNEEITSMLEKGAKPGAFKVKFTNSIERSFEFHSKCQNKKLYICVGKFNFNIKSVYFILRIEISNSIHLYIYTSIFLYTNLYVSLVILLFKK